MGNLDQILTAISIIFAIGTAGFAAYRQGTMKDLERAAETLRKTNDDLRDEVADKDRREAETQEQRRIADEKIQALQIDLASLGKVVTGEAHLVAIDDRLEVFGVDVAAIRVAVDEIHNVLIQPDSEEGR